MFTRCEVSGKKPIMAVKKNKKKSRKKKQTKKLDLLPAIALNIRHYRMLARMTQSDLSRNAKVAHLKMIETGRRKDTRTGTLQKLVDVLSPRLGYRITVEDLRGPANHTPSSEAINSTLKAFMSDTKEGRAASPEEIAELRQKTIWPWGRPTVKGWRWAYQLMREQQKPDNRLAQPD